MKKPIPDEMLQSVLEAGRRAPSCANSQAWNFVVIKSSDMLEKAHTAVSRGNAWGKRAPVMILVAAKEDGGCPAHKLPYFMMDIGLATQNMLLQAVHLGLMGHPTAGWNEEEFLCQASMKAGLPADAWLLQATKIYRFQAIIFEEETPKGEIKLKKI